MPTNPTPPPDSEIDNFLERYLEEHGDRWEAEKIKTAKKSLLALKQQWQIEAEDRAFNAAKGMVELKLPTNFLRGDYYRKNIKGIKVGLRATLTPKDVDHDAA